ncbi:MAG: hypothetical protein EP340_07840 [Alphaproteobacteria bacterium]|nr:MAG: hypothetical protein EP340_07840 [Alphaproteobacteria bacterium]
MSEKKAILGPVLAKSFSYGISNFPTILKAVGIPTVFLTGITLYYLLPSFIEFQQLAEITDQTGDQTQLGEALGPFSANLFLMMIATLFFYPMVITSLSRNIILGEDVPLLNFSGAVLRVLGAMIVIGLMWMGISFVGSILATAILGLFLAVGFYPGILLVSVAFFTLLFAVMAKSSLILPDVAVSGRLRFAEGWQMSRGYLWPLVGTYFVLAIALGIFGNLLGVLALALGSIGADTASFQQAINDESGLEFINAILNLTRTPIGMVAMLFYILGNVFVAGVQFAAVAFAYLQLGTPSADLPSAEN